MRVVIKDMLRENGIGTLGEAADPQEALKEYDRLKPDLVTLDLIMPGGSGVETLRSIIGKNPKAQVLVITESGRENVGQQVARLGAKGLLYKPVHPRRMRQALDALRSGTSFMDSAAPGPAVRTRALVVDDSVLIRSLVKDALREMGLEIAGEAADVGPAIESYDKVLPDILVLDLIMPGGNGTEVLKHVMSRNLKTKVLVLTSVEQTKMDQELASLGAAAVIHKPATPWEIQNAVRKILVSAPPEPKRLADLEAEQVRSLESLFRSGAEACARAVGKMTSQAWESSGVKLRAGNSEEFQAIVDRIWTMRAIPVQIIVKKNLLIIGLVLAPKEAAETLARIVSRKPDAAPDTELLNAALMEITNVLVTAVLNVFANTMGGVILSSSPKILDWPVGEIATRIPKEMSDIKERILIAHSRLRSPALKAECETMFFFRVDYVPRMLGSGGDAKDA